MRAIFEKEIKNYFLTPIGYIFASAFMAISALFFVFQTLTSGYAEIDTMLSYVNIICIFIVPVLTMQSFSEERGKKTDQLLLTAPVKISEIVMGKYFAALCVFLLTLVLSLVFPVILFIIGKPVLSETVGTYVGFVFIWSVFIAIGVYISSMTESQVVAAILTFVVLFVLYLVEMIAGSINNEIAKTVLGWFSVFGRYEDFKNGIFNISSIIYYISFVFVALFLTARNIERRRYS